MTKTYEITGEVQYVPDGIRGTKMTIAFEDANNTQRTMRLPLSQEQIYFARIDPGQDVTVTFRRPVEHIGDQAKETDVTLIRVLAAEQ